jgi:DtxR family transcriptional regulator, Mn-dependent transcriptional regulator
MLPSPTVENYLKAIYLAQAEMTSADELVSMGHLASALGVVPGTATTMVKALSESGLVKYEPYMGVRLTAAGEKLASLVSRRHRLVELFLVKVVGMSWAEVHDEAERLEHAVSDRLIERIAEMLGHPEVDPHGDPIPTADGTVAKPQYLDLLTAPLHTPLVVGRVLDQDATFLRFLEQQQLTPGSTLVIESREPAAEAVRVTTGSGVPTTIGWRAASRVLTRVAEGAGQSLSLRPEGNVR